MSASVFPPEIAVSGTLASALGRDPVPTAISVATLTFVRTNGRVLARIERRPGTNLMKGDPRFPARLPAGGLKADSDDQ